MKIIAGLLFLFCAFVVNAQDKPKVDVKKKVDDRVYQTKDRHTSTVVNKTGDRVDSLIEKGIGGVEKGITKVLTPKNKKQSSTASTTNQTSTDNGANNSESGNSIITANDFTPGSRVLFEDHFTADNTGDFPAKWNTNASGEVVSMGNEKYFKLKGGAIYVPNISQALPKDYTIEFNLKTNNLSRKVSSTAGLRIMIDDNNKFKGGKNRASAAIYFTQYTPIGVRIVKHSDGKEEFKNEIKEDYRKMMVSGCKVSIAVNKNRFRLWMNDNKIVDIPSLIPDGAKHFKLELFGFDADYKIMEAYLGDVRIAAAETDARSILIKQLMEEGKAVTNDILFDTNSDVIKKESYSILNQFGQALQQNADLKIKIIGHTDADGKADANLSLSKKRAAAVKNYLAIKFDIDESKMISDGKGASQPVSDNKTLEGKAKNRRVEFLKI